VLARRDTYALTATNKTVFGELRGAKDAFEYKIAKRHSLAMRLTTLVVAVAALAGSPFTGAFTPPNASSFTSSSVGPLLSDKTKEGSVCEISSEFANNPSSLVNAPNGANAIRSAVVTNYQGDFVRLNDFMKKDGPQVVVYLRHMG